MLPPLATLRQALQAARSAGIAFTLATPVLIETSLAPLPAGLRGSLHYPFAMVASSRNCPYCTGSDPQGCTAGCGEVFRQRVVAQELGVAVLQQRHPVAGRAEVEDLANLGIDRLVWHPLLPR